MAEESYYKKRGWHTPVLFLGGALIVFAWIICFIYPVSGNQGFETIGGTLAMIALALAGVCFFSVKLADRRFHLVTGTALTVAVNLIIGSLTAAAQLPFYLDTIGTVVAGIVGGPIGAALAGTVSSVAFGFVATYNLPFAIVGILVGVGASYAARSNWLGNVYRMILSGIALGLMAGVLASITSLFAFPGKRPTGMQSLVDFFQLFSNSETSAIILQSMVSDPIDKAFTVVVACAFVFYSPHVVCKAVLRPGFEYLDLRLFNMNLLDRAPDGHFGLNRAQDVPLAPFSPDPDRRPHSPH